MRQYFGSQDGIREQVDSEAFQSATDPDWENFSHVSYTRDGVTIYFDAGRLSDVSTGVLSVTIPAKEIYQQMKLNVTGYTKEYTLPDDVDPSKPMIALTFDDGPYSCLLYTSIVGIQVLRLIYYETFSRFYESSGKPFEPVKINFKNEGNS